MALFKGEPGRSIPGSGTWSAEEISKPCAGVNSARMNFDRLSTVARQTTVRPPSNKFQDIVHRVFGRKPNEINVLA
jgi:hypothetical protein